MGRRDRARINRIRAGTEQPTRRRVGPSINPQDTPHCGSCGRGPNQATATFPPPSGYPNDTIYWQCRCGSFNLSTPFA
jgi:hypothetical protein